MDGSLLLFRITSVARLAQSVEHETLNLRIVGLSPTLGAWKFFLKLLYGMVSAWDYPLWRHGLVGSSACLVNRRSRVRSRWCLVFFSLQLTKREYMLKVPRPGIEPGTFRSSV